MSRLLTESFECGHTLRFSAVSSPTIASDSLVDAIRNLNLSGSQFVEYTITSAVAEFYAGFFFRPTVSASTIQLISWASGATELGRLQENTVTKAIDLVVNSVVVASTSQILVDSTNYHIQVHVLISDAGGIIDVRIDDVLKGTFTGDTKPGSDTTVNKIRWGGNNGNARWDTLTLNNTSGSSDNSWPGVRRVSRLAPSGPGFYVNNWSRNTGSTNWEAVDEVPPDDDTTYLFTTTANLYESFSMSDFSISNANIQALLTSAVAKKDSGTVQLAVGIRDDDNSTNYFGVNGSLGTSYGVLEERRTVDPSTGVAFNIAGVNSTQALIDSTTV